MDITFEALNESHFPLMLKWLESPHIKKQDIVYTLDLVKEKYVPYIKGYKQVGESNKPIKAYIINSAQTPIGYIQIYNAHDFARSKPLLGLPKNLGTFDIFIGEEECLGKNIGSQAISKFFSTCKDYSNIFADPDSNNIVAIKSYEKAGFKKLSEQKDVGELWMILPIKA
jgi:aminoglycoside 6'-N-acetyltransferase